jgi:hypothetical protein
MSPWGGANAPAYTGPQTDTGEVELGIKFQTSAAGAVTGIRFYKNPWNTGTHVGNLWSSAGALLASVTFTNETASAVALLQCPEGRPKYCLISQKLGRYSMLLTRNCFAARYCGCRT